MSCVLGGSRPCSVETALSELGTLRISVCNLVGGVVLPQESKEFRDLFLGEFDVDRIHADKLRSPPLIPSGLANSGCVLPRSGLHSRRCRIRVVSNKTQRPCRQPVHAGHLAARRRSGPHCQPARRSRYCSCGFGTAPGRDRTNVTIATMSETASPEFAETTRAADLLGSIGPTIAERFQTSGIAQASSALLRGFEADLQAREMFAETTRAADLLGSIGPTIAERFQTSGIAQASSALLRGFEADLQAREMFAETTRAADLLGSIGPTIAERFQTSGIAQASSALLRGFEADLQAREMFAETTRAADLLGSIDCAAALGHATFAESLQAASELATSLEPFRTPTRRPSGMSALPRTDGTSEVPPSAPEAIEADEDARPSARSFGLGRAGRIDRADIDALHDRRPQGGCRAGVGGRSADDLPDRCLGTPSSDLRLRQTEWGI